MPKDYYPDPDDQNPMADEGDGADESSEGEGKTALIPKSLLGGKEFKVGDEVVLKITHEYEDEVAVEYAPEKPAEEEPGLPGDEEFAEMEETE